MGRKFSINKLTATLLIFLSASIAYSQLSIKTSVDKDTVMIGEPLLLSLEITYPNGAILDIPNEINTFAPLEILEVSVEEPVLTEDKRFLKHITYGLAVFDTGRIVIPPAMIISVSYMGEESRADSIFTGVLHIYCRVSKPDTLQTIHPAAALYEDDYTWIIIISVVVLLLLAYLIWRWYVKKRAEKLNFRNGRVIIEPPEIIALARLAHLKKSKWLEDRKYKKWYTELNELWREYIENRYPHILAMEMTSSELYPILSEIMEESHIKRSREFISMSDLVKFARFNPENIDHHEFFKWVENWINEDTIKMESELKELEDVDQS